MQLALLLDQLVRVAERLGLEVRSEPLEPKLEGRDHGRGGSCMVRGRRVILVDSRAPLPDRVSVLASALSALDLEDVHMPPVVRETIERGGVAASPRPANEAVASEVPPPAGYSWVRVGTAPAANRTTEPEGRSVRARREGLPASPHGSPKSRRRRD